MDKKQLENFLLEARAKTYAGDSQKSESLLPSSVQYDYESGDFSYRDVYYIGNGRFPGLETVYFKSAPVWSMSYFGDFSKMTEEQVDKMLRKALSENWQKTRLYHTVEKDYDDFVYRCDGSGSIDMVEGSEGITVDDETVFYFYYAGGFLG